MDSIKEGLTSLGNAITSGITNFFSHPIDTIVSGITDLKSFLFDKIADIKTILSGLGNNIVDGITNFIKDPLGTIKDTLVNLKDNIVEGFKSFLEAPILKIKDIVSKIAGDIIDGITTLLKNLFVPDAEKINTKVNSIKSKFDFAFEFTTMIGQIKSYLLDSNSQIPVIEINLASAEGKYKYGNSAYVLDMTWYSRYKPTVDKIIIAFAYIIFIFIVFKRLPDIISGAGAITDKSSDVGRGYRIGKGGSKGDN